MEPGRKDSIDLTSPQTSMWFSHHIITLLSPGSKFFWTFGSGFQERRSVYWVHFYIAGYIKAIAGYVKTGCPGVRQPPMTEAVVSPVKDQLKAPFQSRWLGPWSFCSRECGTWQAPDHTCATHPSVFTVPTLCIWLITHTQVHTAHLLPARRPPKACILQVLCAMTRSCIHLLSYFSVLNPWSPDDTQSSCVPSPILSRDYSSSFCKLRENNECYHHQHTW